MTSFRCTCYSAYIYILLSIILKLMMNYVHFYMFCSNIKQIIQQVISVKCVRVNKSQVRLKVSSRFFEFSLLEIEDRKQILSLLLFFPISEIMVSNQHVFVPQGLDMLCHSSLLEKSVCLNYLSGFSSGNKKKR